MKRALFAAAAFSWIAIATPSSASVGVCHPPRHPLAHHKAVVFWKVRRHSRTLIYVCAPATHRPELVASEGSLYPAVSNIEAAGHFVGFFLYPNYSDTHDLVVFDLGHARREFAESPPPSAYQDPLRYLLASNGWVAEALLLGTSPPDPFVQEDQLMFATNDGQSLYTIELLGLSPLAFKTGALSWNSTFGGPSLVSVGPAVIPASLPWPLSACQVVTANDVAAQLGETSSTSPPGGCNYASTFTPGMTLTVGLQTGLTPSQQTAEEMALRSAGWDGLASEVGEFHEYENATTVAGVAHQQLHAFYGGIEISVDLAAPGSDAAEFIAWLADVGFDRLFSIPVQRAL